MMYAGLGRAVTSGSDGMSSAPCHGTDSRSATPTTPVPAKAEEPAAAREYAAAVASLMVFRGWPERRALDAVEDDGRLADEHQADGQQQGASDALSRPAQGDTAGVESELGHDVDREDDDRGHAPLHPRNAVAVG